MTTYTTLDNPATTYNTVAYGINDAGSIVGGGFSNVASYLVLIAVLFVRPYGMLGRPTVERV